MRKVITAMVLVFALLFMAVSGFAVGTMEINTADALNELGLFLGTGNGYELENGLTRAQGVTLLVRMIGMEETAESGVYHNSFTDVPAWAIGYIGYAYENGITNGTGETTFSPDVAMTDFMFLTLVLRALNYSDKGELPMFVWDDPYGLAYSLGLIDSVEPDMDFTRADAISVFWNALDTKLNGTDTTLSVRLVEQGIFSAGALSEAREIQQNGRKDNVGVPIIPTFIPEAPKVVIPETEVPETKVPETEVPETKVPETDDVDFDEGENETPWG